MYRKLHIEASLGGPTAVNRFSDGSAADREAIVPESIRKGRMERNS
jgi:hypothetical protein